MMEEASKVVSMVVDLTNEAWNRYNKVSDEINVATTTQKVPDKKPIVSPEIGPMCVLSDSGSAASFLPLLFDRIAHRKRIAEEESEVDSNIPVENLSNIVDFVIGEIDDKVIAPPAYKKQRILKTL
jgi:hypothetical protein